MGHVALDVRIARLEDAESISRLTAQLGYDADAPAVAARLSRILSRPDHRFFLADLDGRPVGWLHAAVVEYVETGPFVVIAGLVVDRTVRRTGIGRLLMANAEAWAVEQGCGIVRLWSTSARTDAHRFYERLGYSHIKTQYSFVKSVDPAGRGDFSSFIPHIDEHRS
jgi:GNAT superfamily N-acetyltransferase